MEERHSIMRAPMLHGGVRGKIYRLKRKDFGDCSSGNFGSCNNRLRKRWCEDIRHFSNLPAVLRQVCKI